jgi:hypothetical protein
VMSVPVPDFVPFTPPPWSVDHWALVLASLPQLVAEKSWPIIRNALTCNDGEDCLYTELSLSRNVVRQGVSRTSGAPQRG